jgi:GMP synthase (glutamine-hydrolysing)
MKTLLISTCNHSLSEREFVFPISKILGENEHDIIYFEDCSDLSGYEKIIICGTSLQDFYYVEQLPFFDDLLKEYTGSILGICSGMQILTSIFGTSGLIDNVEIGLVEVQTLEFNKLFEGKFQAYNLHNYSVQDCENFKILAMSENSIQAVKHFTREIYGILFHPEVRNEEIITNFLKI